MRRRQWWRKAARAFVPALAAATILPLFGCGGGIPASRETSPSTSSEREPSAPPEQSSPLTAAERERLVLSLHERLREVDGFLEMSVADTYQEVTLMGRADVREEVIDAATAMLGDDEFDITFLDVDFGRDELDDMVTFLLGDESVDDGFSEREIASLTAAREDLEELAIATVAAPVRAAGDERNGSIVAYTVDVPSNTEVLSYEGLPPIHLEQIPTAEADSRSE